MKDVIDFCILILRACMDEVFFGIDLAPGISYGNMMIAILVTEVFISSIVVSFRKKGAPVPERVTKDSGKITQKDGGL